MSIPIPDDQWDMPVTFARDGSTKLTLRDLEALSREPAAKEALSLDDLTPDQIWDLVASRVEMKPDFELAMVGEGIITKKRAVAELASHARTDVARALIEIERHIISRLTKEVGRTVPAREDEPR
ncbi:MAG: hypothetical protein V2B18_00420 [Pseudomonadota bacterium]